MKNDFPFLFDNKFAPITTSMGFIENETEIVANEIIYWNNEIHRDNLVLERVVLKGRLNEILDNCQPLIKGMSDRELLLPTQSNWCMYLDNNYRGTDPTTISQLAVRLNCRSIWVVARPFKEVIRNNSSILNTGTVILEVFDNVYRKTITGNKIRSIRVFHDHGKWNFQQFGEPFPFEKINQYKARKIVDRFSLQDLSLYLSFFNIAPFDSHYFPTEKSDSYLIKQVKNQYYKKNNTNPVYVSLQEARRLNNID